VSKTVWWTSQFHPLNDEKYDNLNDLSRLMWDIVRGTPEFIAMPKPNAGYV